MFNPDTSLPILTTRYKPATVQPAHNPAQLCLKTQLNPSGSENYTAQVSFPNGLATGHVYTFTASTGASYVARVASEWQPGLIPSDGLTDDVAVSVQQLVYALQNHAELGSLFSFTLTGEDITVQSWESADLSLSVAASGTNTPLVTVTGILDGSDPDYGTADPNFTAWVELLLDPSANPSGGVQQVRGRKVDELEKRFLSNGENSIWFDVAATLRNYVSSVTPPVSMGVYADPNALVGYWLRYGHKRTHNFGTSDEWVGRKEDAVAGPFFLLNGGLPINSDSGDLDLADYYFRSWTVNSATQYNSHVTFTVRWSAMSPQSPALVMTTTAGNSIFTINPAAHYKGTPDETFDTILQSLNLSVVGVTATMTRSSWDLAIIKLENTAGDTNAANDLAAPVFPENGPYALVKNRVGSYSLPGYDRPSFRPQPLHVLQDATPVHISERQVYSFVYSAEGQMQQFNGSTLQMHYSYTLPNGYESGPNKLNLSRVFGQTMPVGVYHVVYSASWLGVPAAAINFKVWVGVSDGPGNYIPLYDVKNHYIDFKQERKGRTLFWLNPLGGWDSVGLVGWETSTDRKVTMGERPLPRLTGSADAMRYVKDLEAVEVINATSRWFGRSSFQAQAGRADAYLSGLASSQRVVLFNEERLQFEAVVLRDVKWVRSADEPVTRIELTLERAYPTNSPK